MASKSADSLTVDIIVDLDMVAPNIRNGSITHYQVYVGTEPARDDTDIVRLRSIMV